MNPRVILAIVQKDIVDAIRNTYVLFAIVLPIGMSLLFGAIFPKDATDRVIEFVIYDAGQSQLVQRIQDTPAVSVRLVDGADQVVEQAKKKAIGGLVVAEGFDAALAAGKTPELQVYYNGQRMGSTVGTAFRRVVESALRDMAGQIMPARMLVTDVSSTGKPDQQQDFSLSSFYLLMWLVMALSMVGVFVVPTILVEEREKHTLKAVLVSPASYADVVMGKALVGLLYALLVALILMILNNGLIGNAAVTLLALVLGSLFLVQVGLLIGAAFQNTSQVNTWSSMIMLVFLLPAMFGDFLTPPEPIPTLMHLIPTSYMASTIGLAMSNKATLSTVGLNLAILAVSAVVAFGAVIWVLRRERQ